MPRTFSFLDKPGVDKCVRALFLILATVAATFAIAANANAQGQLAWSNWSNAPTPNSIITFNTTTPGTFNVIGPTGIASTAFINGIEFAGTGGGLYLTTNATTGFLFSVNQTTGAATLIGGSGLTGTDTVGDLSWDPIGNRMLAVGTSGVAAGGARLYTINLTTGAGAPL